jgi:gliding motility-associated-like protein
MMKKLLLSIPTLLLSVAAFGQNTTVLVTDPDFASGNECDCVNDFGNGSLTHFFDDGGQGGNYGDSVNEVITFCPDLNTGTKVTATFATDAGFEWDVDGSDTLYVYDGPTTASPLLGKYNSDSHALGFNHQASWNNPSGCLTFEFVTDSMTVGTGWAANVSCANFPQPYEPHMYAWQNGINYPDTALQNIFPADTGYVDVCPGDSILLIAAPNFPNSLETTGYGYSQNMNNCTFSWSFSDGTVLAGDSVWFTPPAQSGYLISLRIDDPIGWPMVIRSKARVAITPSFASCFADPDTVCLGETSTLIGGITATDTTGVEPIDGAFTAGGTFAGLTPLPDGSGQQYSTVINIIDFDPADTVANGSDIAQICVTLEHSYLGDLEMTLTCPDGTVGAIFDGFPGGMITWGAGFNGGGTYLGDPIDNNTGNPGIGWQYCFDSNNNTFGTMAAEHGAGNTVMSTLTPGASMNPNGVYLPMDNWNTFVGCPLNGPWTITVQDNIGIDDGYIFEWGVFFNDTLYQQEPYTVELVSEQWLADPTIILDTDTLIVVQPDTVGAFGYTFEVLDAFGCYFDTTVNVTVHPYPIINATVGDCDTIYTGLSVGASSGGYWSVGASPAGSNFYFVDSTDMSTPFHYSGLGWYEFIFTDSLCGLSDTSLVQMFQPHWPFALGDTCLDVGTPGALWIADSLAFSDVVWSTNDTTFIIDTNGPGLITFTALDTNGCTNTNDFLVNNFPTIMNDTLICDAFIFDLTANSYGNGGTWSVVTNPTGLPLTISNPGNDATTGEVDVSGGPNSLAYGVYVFQFMPNVCGGALTVEVELFPPHWPFALGDTCLNVGTLGNLWIADSMAFSDVVWSTNDTTFIIDTNGPGLITFTALDTNGCTNTNDFLVHNFPTIMDDILICDAFIFDLTADSYGDGGTWSVVTNPSGLPLTISNPGNDATIGEVDVSGGPDSLAYGVYVFQFMPNVCGGALTVEVELFPPHWPFALGDVCLTAGVPGSLYIADPLAFDSIVWSTGETLFDITINAPGTYTFTATDTNGCANTNDIIVNNISTIMNDTVICDAFIFDLTANSYGNGGTWSVLVNPSGLPLTISNPGNDGTIAEVDVSGVIDSLAYGEYEFQFTPNVCGGPLTVTVNLFPPHWPFAQGDTCLVVGATGVLNINNPGAFDNIVWGDGETTFSITTAGPGVYSWIAVDTNACVNTNTFTVYEAPTIGPDDFECDFYYADLTATAAGGGFWSVVGGPAGAAFDDFSQENTGVTADLLGLHTFSWTDYICHITQSVDILFNIPPSGWLSDYTMCDGDTASLNALTGGVNAVYDWSTGETTQEISTAIGGIYTVQATNDCGSIEMSSEITVNACDIVIPNVFSPNSDGYNDMWVIWGLEEHPGTSVIIFDRWGKEVYSSSDYANNWDGDNQHGGVYYYIVKTQRGGDHSGNIQLIR